MDDNGKLQVKGKEKVLKSSLGCFIYEGKHFAKDCPKEHNLVLFLWRRMGEKQHA